jgi:uncharacterized surface protein with fasciclin (FAS1) repeats
MFIKIHYLKIKKEIMNTIKNKIVVIAIALTTIITQMSCNKDLDTPPQPEEAGVTVGQYLKTTPGYSLFLAAATKAGLMPLLSDSANKITLFLPTDGAMNAAGLTEGVILLAPATTLDSLLKYHIVSGKVTSDIFANTSPNVRFPSNLALDANNGFIRMSVFPALQTPATSPSVNNAPITIPNIVTNNGIIHVIGIPLAPPTGTLKKVIASESTLSYFRAAVTRADSGSVGLSRFDSLMNYNVLNMTVLAPNDNAFRTLVFGLVYSKALSLGATPAMAATSAGNAVAAGPAFLSTNNVTTADMRGIIAYHLVATLTPGGYQPVLRIFGINIRSTPAFVKTLVNSSFATHPGVKTQAYYSTSVLPDSVKFTGLGTFPPGGGPYSGTPAKVLTADKQGVNGVYHIIDAVLFPQ